MVVDTDRNLLRYEVHLFDIDNLILAHIRNAPPGENGIIFHTLSLSRFIPPISGELDFIPADRSGFLAGNPLPVSMREPGRS